MSVKKKLIDTSTWKSFKGGRDAYIQCRATLDVKEKFAKLAAKEGISGADLLEKWVLEAKL